MNKQSLLFVCKFLPYPPRTGAAIRNWAIIRKLSKHYRITLAGFRHSSWQVDHSVLNQYVHEILETAWRPKNYFRIAQNTFQGLPLSIARFADPILCEKIKIWQLNNKEHRVHISELASAILIPQNSNIDVYDAHNFEEDLWEQATSKSPLCLRSLWQWEGNRIANFEQTIIKKSDKVTCVSQENFQKISTYSNNKSIIVLPNGIDLPTTVSKSEVNFNLLFVGQTGWHANDYSLRWFIQTIWLKIKQKFPQAELAIVGGKAKRELKQLIQSYQGISLYENVDSVEPFFQWANVAIAPLLYGSGTSLKVLEYAVHKLPIVCTSVAIRGLSFDSRSVWIAESADNFVHSLNEIWSKSSQTEQKVRHCYKIVKDSYIWDVTLKNLTGNDENSCAYPFSS